MYQVHVQEMNHMPQSEDKSNTAQRTYHSRLYTSIASYSSSIYSRTGKRNGHHIHGNRYPERLGRDEISSVIWGTGKACGQTAISSGTA